MCPIRITWANLLAKLPPTLDLVEAKDCAGSSNSNASTWASRLPKRVLITSENSAHISKLLSSNHEQSFAENYAHLEKFEAMYGYSSIVIDDLNVALNFFSNLPQKVLSKIRSIKLTVNRNDIVGDSDRLLRALHLIADCPPARRVQDLRLKIQKKPPIAPAKRKGIRKAIWLPCFSMWGLLGLQLRITVRSDTKEGRVTLTDVENWLNRIPQGSQVNFLDKLPNELLDIIYTDIVPEHSGSVGRGRGISRRLPPEYFSHCRDYEASWAVKKSTWNDVKNVLKVCPKMAFGITQTTSYQRNRPMKRKRSTDGVSGENEDYFHGRKRLAT